MFRFIFTALAGLLVACTQNSPEINAPIFEPLANNIAPNPVLSITRYGNAEGQTLIFIPGLASDAAVWNDTIQSFSNYDVRVVHLAGFAGMTPVDSPSLDRIQMALSDHLKKAPGRDVVLIGHSLGGFLSLKMALAEPELLKEIIIVDSLPFLAGMMMPGSTPEQAKQIAPAMAQQLASLPRVQFDAQQKLGLARLVKDTSFLPKLEAWSKASDQMTVAMLMGELLASDLRSDIADLQTQATVIMAYDEMMGIPKESLRQVFEAQYSAAPNVNVKVIDGSFHFIMVDQADAFKTVLLKSVEE